jgi:hypothetical protein
MNETEYWVDGTYIVVVLIVVTVVVLVVLTVYVVMFVLADVLKFVVCNVDTVVDELKSSRW